MSILPSFLKEVAEAAETEASTAATAVEPPREYGMDFTTGQLTGTIVEGKEAVKVWIWNCLRTQRFCYPIYSWQYGTDLEQYIGEALPDEYLQVDLQDEIEEALTVNPYITGISDWEFTRTGASVHITFTVITTLGNIEEVFNVEIQ